MADLKRQRELAWSRKVDKHRKRDHDAGKAAQFLGPAAYKHRDKLNRMVKET